MDIKQLQFLCALEQHGHFGQAAEACHITQPTLSMRLKRLEEELGVSLVRRNQRFEGFTPEGQRLLAWAHQVVSAYDGMKTEAQRLKGSLVGTLRIGMVPLSQVCLMPLLRNLREQAPYIRFKLHALSSRAIVEQLENNTLDVGLTYLPQADTERYRIIPLGTPAIGILYHPQWFDLGCRQSTLSWPDIAQLPLGLLSTAMRFRQGIDSSAAAHGINLQPVIESDAVEHLVESVSAGICCTLIPLPSNPLRFEPLQVQALDSSLHQLPLALICRQTNTDTLARALMQQAEQWAVDC